MFKKFEQQKVVKKLQFKWGNCEQEHKGSEIRMSMGIDFESKQFLDIEGTGTPKGWFMSLFNMGARSRAG